MKRYNIVYVMLFICTGIIETSAWSKGDKKTSIGIYCYFKSSPIENQRSLHRLVDANTNDFVTHEAKFDAVFQEYILEKSEYEQYLLQCANDLAGAYVVGLKGASNTSTSLYYHIGTKEAEIEASSAAEWGYFFDSFLHSEKAMVELPKNGFYNAFSIFKDSVNGQFSDEVHNIKKLKIIFDSLPSEIEFAKSNDEVFEATTAEFKENLEKNDSREAFYTEQMQRDFHRMHVQIESDQQLLYNSDLLKEPSESLAYLDQPFALIESYYEMQGSKQGPKVSAKLRETIGLALHSRTQGFDTPGILKLYELLGQYGGNLEFGFGNSTKSQHMISLSETFFSVVSHVRIALQTPHFKLSESFNVGYYDVTRMMVCDLLTDRCSSEQITMKKI